MSLVINWFLKWVFVGLQNQLILCICTEDKRLLYQDSFAYFSVAECDVGKLFVRFAIQRISGSVLEPKVGIAVLSGAIHSLRH